MARTILILTEADDIHAIAVAEALERKGATATLWATSDFPTRTDESVRFGTSGERTIRVQDTGLDLVDPSFDVVWRRRPTYVVGRDALHPADLAFAISECGIFRRSILRLVAQSAFWVNPPDAAALAGSKLLQHDVAAKVGMKMPDTLFTNSPKEIRKFLAGGREVVYKPLYGGGWQSKTSRFLNYTALVSHDNLVEDELLRQTPGIYQERIPKASEIRVTVIGRHALAANVLSQQTEKGTLDWRRAQDELRFEPISLPAKVSDQCFALMDALGIVFGCFDFILTPKGDYVFLEVNEMGQFLFVERYCGLPLLDAFSELLIQGVSDFKWRPEQARVSYIDPEFEAATLARWERFSAAHCHSPETLADEE